MRKPVNFGNTVVRNWITGRVHDWPLQGICCAPLVEGNRLWFVTSRGEVRCVDTEGFYDGEDDGPVTDEVAFVAAFMNAGPTADAHAVTIASLLKANSLMKPARYLMMRVKRLKGKSALKQSAKVNHGKSVEPSMA